MAITFVNKGTWAAGTTSIAPGIPASMQAGDLMILSVHTCNQAVTTPSGWTLVTGSPVSTGTANAAGGTRINTYYRWWQSGDAAPTVAVTGGTVTNGIIHGYRGVDPTTPFDATPVATTLATASTTLTMTGITTATANACIVWSIARDQDLNSTTAVTAFTNANLTGITETHDQVVNTGVGGGIWTGRGFKATAGATGNLTITQTSSIAVGLTIALRPAPNAYTLTAQGGSYTVTGGSASINRNRSLTAQGGSYSLSGQDAVITWAQTANAYTLTALGGSYSLAGGGATISRNRSLTASGGSYALSGGTAIIKRDRRLTASGGAYSLTPASAGINRNRRLTATGGAYAYTGQSANLYRNRHLTAQGGTYAYTGQQVTITYAPNTTAYTLTALGGSYTLAGQAAVLKRSKRIVASGGSYSITGASAGINRNCTLTALGGAYAYIGQTITITKSGMVWPNAADVRLGVQYGPTGVDYTGTYIDLEVKLDLETSRLFKPLTSKAGILL